MRPAYDQTLPGGHLQRSTDVRTESRPTTHISLGMDDGRESPRGLHVVSPLQQNPRQTVPTTRVYEDEQLGVVIPITHHLPAHQTHQPGANRQVKARGSGGGLKTCRQCSNISMPVDPASGLCRVCRKPGPAPVHYPASRAPTIRYNQVKSHQLGTCKRVSCRNRAASNTGLCQPCTEAERRMKVNTQPANAKYRSYY